MPVACGQAVSVIDDNQIAISGFASGINDYTVCGRMYGCPVDAGNIQAKVHFRIAIEWIHPVSIVAGDVATYRPDTRGESEKRSALFCYLLEQSQLALEICRSILQQFHIGFQI